MGSTTDEREQGAQHQVKGSGLWLKDSTCLASSAGLEWQGITIERHVVEAGEKHRVLTSHVTLTLAKGRSPSCLVEDARGQMMPYTKRPGDLTVWPAGTLPRVSVLTRGEIFVCALDTAYLAKIAAEQDEPIPTALRRMNGLRDDAVAGLITLLEQEASLGGCSGRLYVDHLSHALSLRLLAIEPKSRERPDVPPNALPRPRLRRVLDKLHEELSTDIDLQTLAIESGYSRSHFLRMFRAATGLTPHQYLLEVRVRRAQEMIRRGSTSLIDIALACGFSSHSHLSRIFHHTVGITPSQFRRQVS